MTPHHQTIFRTERLSIAIATVEDAGLFVRLWGDPRVMRYVGFPNGMTITHDQMRSRLDRGGSAVFDRLLVVRVQGNDQAIGECSMGSPNAEGIATTDIKLLPEFWGNKYGIEVKRGLIAYLFANTNCIAIEATPNIANLASIKMQEAVGGKRIGEGVYEFPAAMRAYTTPVHHYVYRVSRSERAG
jgi:RimJ/RimL family protein N-acetyltransferase